MFKTDSIGEKKTRFLVLIFKPWNHDLKTK